MPKTTQATLALRKLGIAFKLHTYVYDSSAEHIGLQAAEALDVEPNRVLKTLIESVRLGFERGRNVVETPVMRMMLSEKFKNPMLGLYAAHLLLADEKRDLALLDEIIRNTIKMLGKDFPDVVALAWGYERLTQQRPGDFGDRPWPELLRELQGPPILMRSWDLLVACAQATAPKEITRFPALRVAADLVAAGIYLIWQTRLPQENVEVALPGQVRSVSNDLGLVLAQSSLTARSFDFAAETVDRLKSVLPLGIGLSGVRISAAEIETADQAASALQTLARKYDWKATVDRFLRTDSNLAKFTGLQRDLTTVLRQASVDRQVFRGLDAGFVSALVQSNRIPIGTLADALEGLDQAAGPF